MVERELGVNPSDFRRWVCLHEETHRVQFTSVPWLRAYVQDQMTEFLLASDLDPGAILSRLRAAADAVAGAVRGGDGESLIEAIQTPRQKEILARLTALMTLVEGHGDYVMDAVGPQVVPSVAEIREKFNARRKTAGRVEQAVRRLLGIDLKMRQYADGARFVRAVVDRIGMDGFNKVWESPDTIPTMSEISNPDAWIARVAGGYAGPAAVTAAASGPSVTAPVNGTSPTSSVGPVTEAAPPADVPRPRKPPRWWTSLRRHRPGRHRPPVVTTKRRPASRPAPGTAPPTRNRKSPAPPAEPQRRPLTRKTADSGTTASSRHGA